MSWPEMFSAIERGDLKGLYLIGVDPFGLGIPEEQVTALLEKLDFLVIEDCVKSKACDYAHLVLPAVSFIEKDGTAINSERRIQKLTRALQSPGEALSDFELLNGLIVHFNPKLKMEDRNSVLKEAARFIPDLDGVSIEGLSETGMVLGKENAESTLKPVIAQEPKAAAG